MNIMNEIRWRAIHRKQAVDAYHADRDDLSLRGAALSATAGFSGFLDGLLVCAENFGPYRSAVAFDGAILKMARLWKEEKKRLLEAEIWAKPVNSAFEDAVAALIERSE